MLAAGVSSTAFVTIRGRIEEVARRNCVGVARGVGRMKVSGSISSWYTIGEVCQ